MSADSILQQAAKQAVYIAQMITASAPPTTKRGFHQLAAGIFTDLRGLDPDEFFNTYMVVPVQIHSPCGATPH
jgi:hypothetical protein